MPQPTVFDDDVGRKDQVLIGVDGVDDLTADSAMTVSESNGRMAEAIFSRVVAAVYDAARINSFTPGRVRRDRLNAHDAFLAGT